MNRTAASRRTVWSSLRAALPLAVLALVPFPLQAAWPAATAIPGYTGSGQVYRTAAALSSDHSAAIVWRQNPYDVWIAMRTGATGGWGVTRLSQDTTTTDPYVAMNGRGDLVVGWTGFGYVFARYRPAGGPWEPTKTLEINSSGVASGVRVAINAAGDALVGWVAVNAGATAYEVHAVMRTKAGPWPATGGFQIAGSPGGLWDELTLALDDQGRAAAAWTATYTTFTENGQPTQKRAYVVLGAVRPAGGPWGATFDISPRSNVPAEVACQAGHPQVATSTGPAFGVDPATGDLLLAYFFDPTAYVWSAQDNTCQLTSADRGTRIGYGTVAAPPLTGSDYDVGNVVSSLQASLLNGAAIVGWKQGDSSQQIDTGVGIATGTVGNGLTVSSYPIGTMQSLSVAMGGTQRGFAVSSRITISEKYTQGVSNVAGGGGDGPTMLGNGIWYATVAASCEGYALAAMGGYTDRKVYVSQYPAEAPWCSLALGGGFESGGLEGWLVFP